MSALIFLFTAILFRSLSVHDLGVWFFFTTYISFLDTFRQGFLSTAFIKFFAGTSLEQGREVIGSTWYIATVITIIFVLLNLPLLFILDNVSDDSLRYFFKYFSINLVFSLPMILAMCIAQAKLRFDQLMYIRLCQVSLLIGLLCLLVYLNIATLDNLMYVNLLASFGTSLFCILMGWSGIKFFFFKNRHRTLEIFNFGKYTVGTSISSNLFGLTDTTVMNFMIGPSALAIYNLGKKFMELIEIPLRSFTATAMPTLAVAYNSGNKAEVIAVMKKYIGMVTIGIIPVIFISYLLAPFLMGLIGGGQYKDTVAGEMAVVIFRILLIFSLLSPADRFSAVALDAIHKPQINFYKVMIMLLVNVVSDIIGVYIFDNVYGVVVVSIFPVMVALLISNKYLQDYHRYNFSAIYSTGFKEIKNFINQTLNKS
ncbi:lipopolysaccharide biosynthesis protein [Pedobacter agri]|uniref:lipopolysaccharide biosynthesis protein n=1 Tax=Pedobacter agri TaxID=454586 RepID=UPI002930C617|nr:oligosaccharide flippase family protein [Pedobacter agri]